MEEKIDLSIERIVPDEVEESEVTGGESLKLHLERYRFAAKNIVQVGFSILLAE